jgi:hypothetical protein
LPCAAKLLLDYFQNLAERFKNIGDTEVHVHTLMERIDYEELGDVELDDETSARLDDAIAQAESEFRETRLNFHGLQAVAK